MIDKVTARFTMIKLFSLCRLTEHQSMINRFPIYLNKTIVCHSVFDLLARQLLFTWLALKSLYHCSVVIAKSKKALWLTFSSSNLKERRKLRVISCIEGMLTQTTQINVLCKFLRWWFFLKKQKPSELLKMFILVAHYFSSGFSIKWPLSTVLDKEIGMYYLP